MIAGVAKSKAAPAATPPTIAPLGLFTSEENHTYFKLSQIYANGDMLHWRSFILQLKTQKRFSVVFKSFNLVPIILLNLPKCFNSYWMLQIFSHGIFYLDANSP